jgi:hypothetical protein
MNNSCLILLPVLAALFLAGCSTPAERVLSQESVPFASLPDGHDPLNPKKRVAHGPVWVETEEGIIEYYERARGHALNILELSGGGQYGAFGAGFLKGWRQTGTRPEFDVVSGVSTGALLATHALLGSAADDAVLEEIYTHINASSIYTQHGLIHLLFGASAVYDTSPMQELLDKYITAEVLQRVAAAHDDNRRLFVGTTNLDYDQTWVWNMGLIAKQGGPEALELYKKVLRASASPPIAFPPVEIAGHLFGDGGVRQNIVVIGLAGDEKPQPPKYGPGTIYVIHNGKETRPPHALSNSALHIAGPVLDTMLTSSMETLLLRSYFAAHARGYRFKLVAIPDAPDIGHNALAFDHQQMQVCFDAGYALARQPDPWLTQPRALDDIPGWAFELMGM